MNAILPRSVVVGVGDVDVDACSSKPSAGVDGVDTQLVVLLLVEVQRLGN